MSKILAPVNDSQSVHLVYASDTNYLRWLLMPVASAYYWASEPSRLVVHVLTTEVNSEDWNQWHEMIMKHTIAGVRIIQHDIPASSFVNFKRWHGSLATYNRLILPEVLHDVEWCVYADADTLFVDDPLKLIDVYDSHCAVQGRKDRAECIPELYTWYKKHRLPFEAKRYFCAGFIIMNLKMFRENNLVPRLMKFLNDYPDCMYADQDAINVICFNMAKLLPNEWGVFGSEAFSVGRPSLIHYAGCLPWSSLQNYVCYNDAFRAWFCYAKLFFGKNWGEIIVSKIGIRQYWRMRALGFIMSSIRVCLPADCRRFYRIGDSLFKRYAARGIWKTLFKK